MCKRESRGVEAGERERKERRENEREKVGDAEKGFVGPSLYLQPKKKENHFTFPSRKNKTRTPLSRQQTTSASLPFSLSLPLSSSLYLELPTSKLARLLSIWLSFTATSTNLSPRSPTYTSVRRHTTNSQGSLCIYI